MTAFSADEPEVFLDRASRLVDAALSAGADACDVVVAASQATGVDVREGKVEETESAENNAFSLRAFVGDRSAAVSANESGNETVLAQRAVAMAKMAPPDPYAGLAGRDMLATNVRDLDLYDDKQVSFEEMRDIALACEQAVLGVDGVSRSSGAGFSMVRGTNLLATSDGFRGGYRSSRFSVSATAIAGDGTQMQRDFDYDGQRHFADLRNVEAIGRRAGERAVASLAPRQIPTQTATIVYDRRVAGSLLAHLAGAINGSAIVRGTSFLKDSLGKRIFREDVSVVDEPGLLRGAASRPFDGEGVGTFDLDVVTDGMLNAWYLDSGTARELGLQTNGRANRAGSGTTPGSTNLTLCAGSHSLQDLLKEVGTGLYVTQLIGQGVSLVTGDYSRGISGFWIENGEITFPVSEVTIAGNLRDMFARMIPANDLERRMATSSPAVAVEGMTIAGT